MLKVKSFIRLNLLFWNYYSEKSDIHNFKEESSINEKDQIFLRKGPKKQALDWFLLIALLDFKV